MCCRGTVKSERGVCDGCVLNLVWISILKRQVMILIHNVSLYFPSLQLLPSVS